MKTYDPRESPDPGDWLRRDETARIELVESYHRRRRVRMPNVRLHATIHVIVENQLALGGPVVVETLARLRGEGLTRHDAIHAIGSVLAERIYDLLKHGPPAEPIDPNVVYLDGLRKLTAADWRKSALPRE